MKFIDYFRWFLANMDKFAGIFELFQRLLDKPSDDSGSTAIASEIGEELACLHIECEKSNKALQLSSAKTQSAGIIEWIPLILELLRAFRERRRR